MKNGKDNYDQKLIDPFHRLNRYKNREKDRPSKEVFEEPRRTLGNGWVKFHAVRECGSDNVRLVESSRNRPISEEYEYILYCYNCRHKIPEDEVLFIGGQWYDDVGIMEAYDPLYNLHIPSERVLELGPNPDQEELIEALNISRIEKNTGPGLPPIKDSDYQECQTCGKYALLLFDGNCRMHYDGPWTNRLQQRINTVEKYIREWENNSYVHRLEKHIDPLQIGPPVPKGLILWRRSPEEPTPKMVEVTRRLKDCDTDEYRYVVSDLCHRKTYEYSQDELTSSFYSCELYNDSENPLDDEEIQDAYQYVYE